MKKTFAILMVGCLAAGLFQALQAATPDPQDHRQALARQGVSPEQIIGTDSAGVPLVSAAPIVGVPVRSAAPESARLESGLRGWEVIPGVVRANDSDTFRVEVDVNGPVLRVTINVNNFGVIPSNPMITELRDDGMGEDRLAGDFIFTSIAFRYASWASLIYYSIDPAEAPGIGLGTLGWVTIYELDGTETSFLNNPTVGLLRPNVPLTSSVALAPDVQVSPHLINVRGDGRAAQNLLRSVTSGEAAGLASRVYTVLPDSFDFLVLLSTNKVERRPYLTSANFYAGVHWLVRADYTGTGLAPFDNSGSWGSSGRLLGVSTLDAYGRGVVTNNLTHELSHQWGAWTSRLNDGTAHYPGRSSVGSLIGGSRWTDNGDGTFGVDCNEGRSGAHHAAPLDLYMMGLIDGSAVPDVHIARDNVDFGPKCDGQPLLPDEIDRTVTIADLQLSHGVRSPGPTTAQRDFRLAFVAESRDRLFTPPEMTFYEILAAHYTKTLAPQEPDPYVGFNWVPVTRFFGHGTTWRSDLWQDLGVTMTAKLESPQPAGSAIGLIAAGTGGLAPYEYRFWIQPWGGAWQVVRDWGEGDFCSWQPTIAGGYNVAVEGRSRGGTAAEAQYSIGFLITPGGMGPMTSVTMTPDLPSAQRVGTTIKWTATGQGGSLPYAYRFWVQPWGGAWSIVTEWSPATRYAWTPTAPGGYNVAVEARGVGATIADVQSSVGFFITP